MDRFAPALRRVSRELDLPRRLRTELLLEMAADLEAVFEHHRGRGVAEDEAARRAEEAVLGSPEVIRRLGRLHASPWRSWAEDVGARLSGGLELGLLIVGVVPILALGGGAAVRVLAADPSPLAWSILLVGFLMTALAATEWIRLLRSHPLRRPYLPSLLVLAAMATALGLLAPVLGLHRATTGHAGEGPGEAALLATVVRDGATFLAGLLVGIGGLLAWFLLVEREARRATREVEALLSDASPQGVPGSAGGDARAVIPLMRRRQV